MRQKIGIKPWTDTAPDSRNADRGWKIEDAKWNEALTPHTPTGWESALTRGKDVLPRIGFTDDTDVFIRAIRAIRG
jgi:hypothetical protein